MEKLYNNILLQDDFASQPSDPDNIPYLKNPPEVINVSVGRQLFIDDFLIAQTDLMPEVHTAKKFEGNPVLFPATDWECDRMPVACPKSGGVWYDEKEHLFKMWYEAGWVSQMCYATSRDGIHWERPDLDLEPGTNKIMVYDHRTEAMKNAPERYLRPDSTTFFIDDDDPDPARRYKMFLRNPGGEYPGIVASSADGIHWENYTLTSPLGDRSTMFYNPFRKKWVYSIRSGWSARSRLYRECDDLFAGATWHESEASKWLRADENDLPHPYIGMKPQLYNVDAVGYESIMLGMFQIHYGPENNFCHDRGVPKITELIPMYSRDGYHFSRPCRESLIGASMIKGSWDRGYVQSVGGVTVIHGDELWIYYIGFAGDETVNRSVIADEMQGGTYMNGATGLAKLRRDGFISMNGSGSLLTRKLTITGKHSLHVNLDGSVRVSILNENGDALAVSQAWTANSTNATIVFEDFAIRSLNDSVFRLRFEVDGKLYSFGFADENGDFNGAHAAGIVK